MNQTQTLAQFIADTGYDSLPLPGGGSGQDCHP